MPWKQLQMVFRLGLTFTETGGESLIAQARPVGVEYLFTNPGSSKVAIFDALVDDPQIHLIEGLHEGVVISMADGYHKVSQKPAFVNVNDIAGTEQMAGQLFNCSTGGSAIVVTAGQRQRSFQTKRLVFSGFVVSIKP
jgi:thiamine pyrophosphate-dependent acetolactate synthase large subunit-like protein